MRLVVEDATQFVGAVEGGRFRPLFPSWSRTKSCVVEQVPHSILSIVARQVFTDRAQDRST